MHVYVSILLYLTHALSMSAYFCWRVLTFVCAPAQSLHSQLATVSTRPTCQHKSSKASFLGEAGTTSGRSIVKCIFMVTRCMPSLPLPQEPSLSSRCGSNIRLDFNRRGTSRQLMTNAPKCVSVRSVRCEGLLDPINMPSLISQLSS